MKVLSFSILLAVTMATVLNVPNSQAAKSVVSKVINQKIDDTLDIYSLRESHNPEFIESLQRRDEQYSAKEDASSFNSAVAIGDPKIKESSLDDDKKGSVQTFEAIMEKLSALTKELFLMSENGEVDLKRYYSARNGVFAIEKELQESYYETRKKVHAIARVENLLSTVKVLQEKAEKQCEKSNDNYCVFFSPDMYSRGAQFVTHKMTSLMAELRKIEKESPKFNEYLKFFQKLEEMLNTLKNMDMRAFKTSPFYLYLQREVATTAYVATLVRSAFAA